jgi:hypothetical protein
MQKHKKAPFAICRIVTGSDFVYSAYVCTPHFADGAANHRIRSAAAAAQPAQRTATVTCAGPAELGRPSSPRLGRRARCH